jgi:tetratricopeptide (TPR) repeat protein
MRTQLNGRLLAAVGSGVVVLAVAVVLLHGVQVRRGARSLLQSADAAEQQGRTADAAKVLGDYLTLVPEDSDVQARYGLLLEQLPGPESRPHALAVFRRVLARRPDRDDVRRHFIRLALDLGRFDDARQQLAVLMGAFPDDAELEQALGHCQEADRDYAGAADWYARAVQHDPHRVDSYTRLARLLRLHLAQPARADQLMDDLVAANSDSAPAYLARAFYRRDFGSLEDAALELDRARQLAPQDTGVLLACADLAQERGRWTGARADLRRCLELDPRDLRAVQALAMLEDQAGRCPDAVACLRLGLQSFPEQPDMLAALAELLIAENQPAGANALVARLGPAGGRPEQIAYLEARLLLHGGQRLEAARALVRLRSAATPPELLDRVELFLGQCYAELGDTDRQLAMYRRAVERNPLSSPLRLALASALADAGRADEAIAESWQALSGRNPPAAGWGVLVRLLMRRHLDAAPAQRDWAEVDRALDLAVGAAPEVVEIPVLRAEALRLRNQPEQARAALEAVKSQFADRAEIPIALADLAGIQGDSEVALRILEEAGRQFGDRVDLRLARARCWARRGTSETAVRLGELEQDLGGLTPADRARLLGGLAEVYSSAGDSRQARRLWTRVADADPNGLNLRLLLFDGAVRDEDEALVQRLLADIRRIEGEEGALWRYAEAMHALELARRGNRKVIADARTRLAEVGARRPTWARVPLLAANLDELEGNPKQALEDYLRAIELGDRQTSVLRRVAQLLAEQGRHAEAERLLSRLQH